MNIHPVVLAAIILGVFASAVGTFLRMSIS